VLNTKHDDSLKVQTPSGVGEDWRRLKGDSATGPNEPRHVSRIRRDWKHGLGADPSLTASFSPIAVVVVLSPHSFTALSTARNRFLSFSFQPLLAWDVFYLLTFPEISPTLLRILNTEVIRSSSETFLDNSFFPGG